MSLISGYRVAFGIISVSYDDDRAASWFPGYLEPQGQSAEMGA